MYDIKAFANRGKDGIQVTISGMLASSCIEAKIVDIYPGGNIIYIRNPGYAQVFIEERKKPGESACIFKLIPWVGHTGIPDMEHNEVQILINSKEVLKVPIKEISIDEKAKFQVIALVASSSDRYEGCSIIPEGASYPMIYTTVFGPASQSECEKWVADNCAASD